MKLLKDNLLVKILCLRLGIRGFPGGVTKGNPRICQVTKRGQMLGEFIKDRDKKKHWHFQILQNNAKSKNVFEKMSRPHRRQGVLNALFIRNISDVISTGDVAPEILGYGIEIRGVKVSPCCQILNVYWQVGQSNFDKEEDIGMKLNLCGPKIRAELISRNVMGKVPQIFFIRDSTNSYVAAFEKAMKDLDLGPEPNSTIVSEEIFISKKKKMFKFTDSKEDNDADIKKEVVEPSDVKDRSIPPNRPHDMKIDIFGLNHEILMNRVMALKSKTKPILKSHVISPECNEDTDLFSKIPGGTTIYTENDREKILKEFHLERKLRMNKKALDKEDEEEQFYEYSVEDGDAYFADDFIEEDTPERF